MQYPPGSDSPLVRHDSEDLEFSLPFGVEGEEVKWLSVWCREYSIDLGSVWLTEDMSGRASSYSLAGLMIVLLSWSIYTVINI